MCCSPSTCSTLTPKRSISLMVMSTYGLLTSSSVMMISTPSPSVASGAAMSRAVRYWLLTLPLSRTVPDGIPEALISTGGQPVPRVQAASMPSCTRPSTRSWIGLSRMRAMPSRTKVPLPAAATAAVSGRMAVPAFPRNSSAPSTGNFPAQPCTVILRFSQSSSSSTPRSFRAPTMYRMSSLSRRFSTSVVPSDKAARRRMRLDRDLEPGRSTSPLTVVTGAMVSCSSVVEAAALQDTEVLMLERRLIVPVGTLDPASCLPVLLRCLPLGAEAGRGARYDRAEALAAFRPLPCAASWLCKATGAWEAMLGS
mmetsp:Transcript_29095/g.82004  ORF Transcript_29095/g.82004 Transcript_29095/m.82004 type:complete len:311 (+) Transcript_29095:958-1890(+)